MPTRGVSKRRYTCSTICRSTAASRKTSSRPDVFSFPGSKADHEARKADAAAKERHRREQKGKAPPRERRSATGQHRDPRGRRPHAGADEVWSPTQEDVLEVIADPPGCCWRKQQYAAVAITVLATKTMLAWLMPQLGVVTGARVADRGGRGASIVLTRSFSRSGAYADHMDTVVYCHLGQRKVWLAKPLDTDGSLPRTDKRDGKEPKLLTDACDPVVSPDAREFLRWLKPVDCSESGAVEGGIILHAGDALYIPQGWWHSVEASTQLGEGSKGAVGVALEVARGSVNVPCAKPWVFKGVGPCARRAAHEWRSWKSCVDALAPAIEP